MSSERTNLEFFLGLHESLSPLPASRQFVVLLVAFAINGDMHEIDGG